MRSFYRLLNIEFAKWLVIVVPVCAIAIVAPLILLQRKLRYYSEFTVNERYEDVFVASGSGLLYAGLLVVICGYFLLMQYADYWGSKSIYTYLTLPVKREHIYFSRLLVLLTALLMLLASIVIGIRIGYALYASKVAGYGDGQFVMHNGYFLAVIRSDLFRLILPLSFSRIISSLGLLTALATGLYNAVLCERSRQWFALTAVAAAAGTIFWVVGYRLNEEANMHDPTHLYISSALLFALSGWFVWHSLRTIRSGAIA